MEQITLQQLRDHLSVFEPGFPLQKGYVAQLLLQHSVPEVIKKIKAIVTAAEPNKNLLVGGLNNRLRDLKKFINSNKLWLLTEWPMHIAILLEPFLITFQCPTLPPALKSTPSAAASSEDPEQTSTQIPVKLKHLSRTANTPIHPDLPQIPDKEMHSDLPQTSDTEIHSDLPQIPYTEIHTDLPQTPDIEIHTDLPQTPVTEIHTDLPQIPDTEIHSDLPQIPYTEIHTDLPQTPDTEIHSDLPQTPDTEIHSDLPQTPYTQIHSDILQTSTPTQNTPPTQTAPENNSQSCSATYTSQAPIIAKKCCICCVTRKRTNISVLQKNERLHHQLKELKTLFGAESEYLLLKKFKEKIRRKTESVMVWRNKYTTLKASNDTHKLLDSVYSLEQKVKTLEENLIAAQEESLNMTSVIEQLKSMHEKTENYESHLKYLSLNSQSPSASAHTEVEENGTIAKKSQGSVCQRDDFLSDRASKGLIINTENMNDDVRFEEENTHTHTEAAESVIIMDYQMMMASIKNNQNDKCHEDLQQGRSSKLLEQGLSGCQKTTQQKVAKITNSSVNSLEKILARQKSFQPSDSHHAVGNKCDSSDPTFKENIFQKHRLTQANHKLYKCDDSGRPFPKDSFLKIHKRGHIGHKPYKYDVCGRGLSLKAHQRVHNRKRIAEKPYKCDFCGLTFSRSDNLDVHKRSHIDVSLSSPSPNAYAHTDVEEKRIVNKSQGSLCQREDFLSDRPSKGLLINTENMGEDVSYTQEVGSEEKNTHTHTEATESVIIMDYQMMMAGIKNNQNDKCHEDLQQGCSSKLLEQGLSDCQKTTQQEIANINSSIKCLEEILASKKSCQPSVLHVEEQGTVGNKCDSPGRTFTENVFQKHKLTDAKCKPYKCDVCGLRFAKDSLLKIHKRVHITKDKTYKHYLPDRGFYVRMHTRRHTGENPYKCHVCGLTFSESGDYDAHKQLHVDQIPYKCDFCGLCFMRKSSLEIHTRTHISRTPFKCEVCGLEFEEKAELRKHKKVHKGEKNCVCDTCGKRFKAKSDLTLHNRKHTGEKPYHCDVCGRSFAYNNAFKSHIRIHTEERPYKCDVCGFAFRTASSLTSHKFIHTGEKPYMCEICGFQVNRKDNLRLHKRVHQKKT